MGNIIATEINRTSLNLLFTNLGLFVLCNVLYWATIITHINYIELRYAMLLPILPGVAFSLWNIIKAVKRLKNPLTHPIYKTIKAYGEIALVENSIVSEFRNKDQFIKFPKVLQSKSWIVIPHFYETELININSVFWIYKVHLTTRHRINFSDILAWNSHSYAVKMLYYIPSITKLDAIVLTYSENKVDDYIKTFYQRNPWVHLGYSDKMDKEFRDKPNLFIGVVEYKRKEMLNKNQEELTKEKQRTANIEGFMQ